MIRRQRILFVAALVAINCAVARVAAGQDSSAVAHDTVDAGRKPALSTTTPSASLAATAFGDARHSLSDATARSIFGVDRVSLTLRADDGGRASMRVTAELSDPTPAIGITDDAWLLRARYAYLQYQYVRGADWGAVARIGVVQTALIEHEETFWPRWIAKTPADRAAFFSSSSVGAATLLALPRELGEVYAAATNGQPTLSRAADHIVDYQLRTTVTPLRSLRTRGLSTLTLDAWTFRGEHATGLARDRWGVFAGIRDPRLTIGAEYDERTDGAKAVRASSSPGAVIDTTEHIRAAYLLARPLQLLSGARQAPLGIVLRYDRVTSNVASAAAPDLAVFGLVWDRPHWGVSLDYQAQIIRHGAPAADARDWYAHWIARF